MPSVCFISDTHCQVHKISIPGGDMLIHAGDLTYSGSLEEMKLEMKRISDLPHKYKVIICGNHDRLGEKEPDVTRKLAEDLDIIYLHDRMVEVCGLRIWGSPYTPEFQGWAFNLPRGKRLAEKWAPIPDGLDILITHGPPHGILDVVQRMDDLQWPNDRMLEGRLEHVGCHDLLKAVLKIEPRFHVFGHVHGEHGIRRIGKTLFINAASCDPSYRPVHKPHLLEIAPNA